MLTKGSSKRLRIFKSPNPSNFNLNVIHDIEKIYVNHIKLDKRHLFYI